MSPFVILLLKGKNMKRIEFINNPTLLIKDKVSIEKLNEIVLNDKDALIKFEEEKYHNQVIDLVIDFLSYSNKKIILLCGPTSSGKTTTSKIIKQKLIEFGYKSVAISLDDFLVPLNQREVLKDGSLDWDSFATINVKLFNKFLKELVENKVAQKPIYNFVKNRPEDFTQEVKIDNNTILIVEGLHALNPELIHYKKGIDSTYKIYISPNSNFYLKNKIVLESKDLRLMRRCLRDYYHRGVSIAQSMNTWKHTIESENLYIHPYKNTVDYIINSTHRYELMLYAKYLKPLLMQTEGNREIYHLIKPLDASEKLDKSCIPENSLLLEFVDKD